MREDTEFRCTGRNGGSGLKKHFFEKRKGDAGERGRVDIRD